jgi:hypothetical protein
MKLYNNMRDTSHLSQLGKTIQARKKLKNMFQEKQLENLGLYEQAARIQEPITKTITETAEETKKELKKVLNAIEQQPLGALLPPQHQHAVPIVTTPEDAEILSIINNETNTGLTNNTLSHINTINNVKAFTIGSGSNKELFGLKNRTLVNIDSKEEYLIPSVGVAKLLFQSKPTEDDVTKDDVDEYIRFLDQYKFTITQNSKRKILQKFYPKTRTSIERKRSAVDSFNRVDATTSNAVSGEGVKVMTIPSDPNKLREALILQLADVQAGNNNNFNYTNAIMKEMLLQKLITSKDYRAILKECFHV